MTSADFARQATITFDQWCAKMQKPGYLYKATAWYKAGKALEAETHPAAPPPNPTPDPLAAYRSILFMAQEPLEPHIAPAYWKVAYTADPAYDQYATVWSANLLRDAGHMIYVWYVPTEVTKARANEVAARLGAPVILGQCETAEQFDASVAHGRRAMVGNLSALRPDQLERVASGQNVVVNEAYYGCQPGLQPDWKNANAGVAGNCLACYQDADCQRIPLAQQIANGWFVPHRDSLYGPGLQAEDYAVLT